MAAVIQETVKYMVYINIMLQGNQKILFCSYIDINNMTIIYSNSGYPYGNEKSFQFIILHQFHSQV